MNTTYLYLSIMMAIAIACSACSDQARSNAVLLDTTVINKTSEKYTEVSVNGRGYPGRFGILVSGGNATMFHYAIYIDNEFTVTWRSSTGTHSRKLTKPQDFDLSGTRRLIVEFEKDGEVKAYSTMK